MGLLDPEAEGQVGLTARQLELITYVVMGEALGEGATGMQAVANVINNRAQSGRYPHNPYSVALQGRGSQFNAAKSNILDRTARNYPKGSPEYRAAEAIVVQVLAGQLPDITGNATHYYANTGANAIKEPNWFKKVATAGGTQIGNHAFASRTPTTAAQSQVAPTPATMSSGLRAEPSIFRSMYFPEITETLPSAEAMRRTTMNMDGFSAQVFREESLSARDWLMRNFPDLVLENSGSRDTVAQRAAGRAASLAGVIAPVPLVTRKVQTVDVNPTTGMPYSSREILQRAITQKAASLRNQAQMTEIARNPYDTSRGVVTPAVSPPGGVSRTGGTEYVRPDGSSYTLRPGETQLPAGVRPSTAPASSLPREIARNPYDTGRSSGTTYYDKPGVEYGYNTRTGNYEEKQRGESYDVSAPRTSPTQQVTTPTGAKITQSQMSAIRSTAGVTTTRTSTISVPVTEKVLNPAYTVYMKTLAANERMTPTGAVIDAEMYRAINDPNYVPPKKPPPLGPPPPQFITVTKQVKKTVQVPVKKSGTIITQRVAAPVVQTTRIATGKTAIVGQTFNAGGYTYQVRSDGSILNTTTGRVSAAAPKAPAPVRSSSQRMLDEGGGYYKSPGTGSGGSLVG